MNTNPFTCGLAQRCSCPQLASAPRQTRQQRKRCPIASAAAGSQPPPSAAPAAAAPDRQQQRQQQRASVPVTFILAGEEVTVEAQPGQNIWELASKAGADITLGCSQGSCGICEVEVWKYSSGGSAPSTGVVRACIAGVPPGYERLEVREVPLDDIWGVDGFDT